jgi:hypothetical protein
MIAVDVYSVIEAQLPEGMASRVMMTVDADPYLIRVKLQMMPVRKPELLVEAILDRDLKIPDAAMAHICLITP